MKISHPILGTFPPVRDGRSSLTGGESWRVLPASCTHFYLAIDGQEHWVHWANPGLSRPQEIPLLLTVGNLES